MIITYSCIYNGTHPRLSHYLCGILVVGTIYVTMTYNSLGPIKTATRSRNHLLKTVETIY